MNKNEVDKENLNEEELDWDEISFSIDEEFNDLYQENFLKQELGMQTYSEAVLNKEILMYSEEVSKNYLETFQNEHATLEIMLETIKSDFPDFENVYNQELEKNKEENLDDSIVSDFFAVPTINVLASNAEEKSLKFLNKMKEVKKVASITSAAAILIAAAAWASAGWFGISIPRAVTATIAAVSSASAFAAAITGIIGFFTTTRISNLSSEEQGKWFRSTAASVISAINSVRTVLKIIAGTMSATGWAVKAAFALGSLLWITLAVW